MMTFFLPVDHGPPVTAPRLPQPNLSSTLQVPSTMAHEQSNQISESEGSGRNAFRSEKAAFEIELMRKESNACITASAAAAAAAAIAATVTNVRAPVPRKAVGEEDYIIGEVPLEVTKISLYFAGLT